MYRQTKKDLKHSIEPISQDAFEINMVLASVQQVRTVAYSLLGGNLFPFSVNPTGKKATTHLKQKEVTPGFILPQTSHQCLWRRKFGAHTSCKWFFKGQVTLCNLTLLSFGKAGSSGKAHSNKKTSTRPPSFSKAVRLSFLDFTPPL